MEPVEKPLALVTGATGFVGGALARRLLREGYRVRILVRNANNPLLKEIGLDASANGRLEIVEGDIAVKESLEAAFDGVRYVFHVAAMVSTEASWDAYRAANVSGTENMCELALRHGIAKFVYVSTADVFGLPRAGEVVTEATPHAAWNEKYADTKIAGTRVVKDYQARGLVSTIIYPGWVYGPGDRALLPSVLEQLESGFLPLWSPNSYPLGFIYVEDLVDAMLQALASPAADNEDFLILDAETRVGMLDLCARIAERFGLRYRVVKLPYWLMYGLAALLEGVAKIGIGGEPLITTAVVKSFGHCFIYSTEKAAARLRWTPATPFETGIRQALDWHCEHLAVGRD